MKRLRKLIAILCLSVLAAGAVGIASHTYSDVKVKQGLYFGPPEAQQKMEFGGTYSISRWGFPATYREVQKFKASEGASYETSYVSKPFNVLLVLTNIVLLLSFFVALLAPIPIFWRPKKLAPVLEVEASKPKSTEKKPVSQAEKDANTRH
jgi:hypothetical protein